MQWGPQQSAALDICGAWLRRCRGERRLSQPIFRIFGYAGTGKTTLARTLAESVRSVAYGAYTGKAALIMARSGCADASTLHSLMYSVDERADGSARFVWNPESAAASADLLTIDEASMCNEEVARDLMRYGRPILVLGDPAQLPPVEGEGYFTNAKPDVMLTEIHRQAAENPIIRLASATRQGERLALGEYGASRVIERGVLSGKQVMAADQVLVGLNATRKVYNRKLRALHGFEGPLPQKGDRLICLRNDKSLGIFNGGLFTVLEMDGRYSSDRQFLQMILKSEDFPSRKGIAVRVHESFFIGDPSGLDWRDLKGSQQFDFGYALTTHKAQGSQWGSVIVYDESATFRDDWQRWLYTAITRAAEKVTIVK